MTCGDSVGRGDIGDRWGGCGCKRGAAPTPRAAPPQFCPPHPGEGPGGLAAVAGAGTSVQGKASGATPAAPGGPMQGWGGDRPGPGGEQAPSLSSSALGDAATTAPLPPSLPPLFFRGAPAVRGSCPAENEPTCDAGVENRGRAKACVCPQAPQNFGGVSQGIPAAGAPPIPLCLWLKTCPGKGPGQRKLPVLSSIV